MEKQKKKEKKVKYEPGLPWVRRVRHVNGEPVVCRALARLGTSDC